MKANGSDPGLLIHQTTENSKEKMSPALSVPHDHINPKLQKCWALFIHLTHK